jgi:hypothetical protein
MWYCLNADTLLLTFTVLSAILYQAANCQKIGQILLFVGGERNMNGMWLSVVYS